MPGYREITVPGEARRPRRAPARTPAGAGEWRAVLVGALAAALASCRNSPGAVAGSLVGLGAAGFICFNALGHQSGRHPAPILPKVAAPKAQPPREAAAAPAREAAREPAKEASKEAVRAIPMPAPPKQAARDPIGELIRSDETTASVTPRAEPARAKAAGPGTGEASILRVQRALAKLGYPVKPDGAMGPGTRAAIEKFERSAKLPVTGAPAGRTLRALVSRAGQG